MTDYMDYLFPESVLTNHEKEYQLILENCYQQAHQLLTRNISNAATTYGEIIYESMCYLIRQLTVSSHDCFLDLGSGMGRTVLQWYALTSIQRAVGIELIESYHQIALDAKATLIKINPWTNSPQRHVDFIAGNFFKQPLPPATIVFINAMCFSQHDITQLGLLLQAMPSVHTIISIRPINVLTSFRFIKAIRVECTWDSALCYIYRRYTK